jgi:hypothetical protein
MGPKSTKKIWGEAARYHLPRSGWDDKGTDLILLGEQGQNNISKSNQIDGLCSTGVLRHKNTTRVLYQQS